MTQYIIEVTLVGGEIKYVTDNKTYAPMTDNKDAAMRFTDKEEVEVLAQQYVQFATMFSSLGFTEKATVRIITEENEDDEKYLIEYVDKTNSNYRVYLLLNHTNHNFIYEKEKASQFSLEKAQHNLKLIKSNYHNNNGTFKIIKVVEEKHIDKFNVVFVNNYLGLDRKSYATNKDNLVGWSYNINQACQFEKDEAKNYTNQLMNIHQNLYYGKFIIVNSITGEELKDDVHKPVEEIQKSSGEYVIAIGASKDNYQYVTCVGNGKPRISRVKPKFGVDYNTAEYVLRYINQTFKKLSPQINNFIHIVKIDQELDESDELTFELKPLADDFWKTVKFGDKVLIKLSNGDIISCTAKQNEINTNEGVLVDCYGYVVDETLITHITKI